VLTHDCIEKVLGISNCPLAAGAFSEPNTASLGTCLLCQTHKDGNNQFVLKENLPVAASASQPITATTEKSACCELDVGSTSGLAARASTDGNGSGSSLVLSEYVTINHS
jgi:hypothetical protein